MGTALGQSLYATRDKEVVALWYLCKDKKKNPCLQVGISKEILTDQSTTFMSRTLRKLYEFGGGLGGGI